MLRRLDAHTIFCVPVPRFRLNLYTPGERERQRKEKIASAFEDYTYLSSVGRIVRGGRLGGHSTELSPIGEDMLQLRNDRGTFVVILTLCLLGGGGGGGTL